MELIPKVRVAQTLIHPVYKILFYFAVIKKISARSCVTNANPFMLHPEPFYGGCFIFKGIIWICSTGNEVEEVVAPALYPGTIYLIYPITSMA